MKWNNDKNFLHRIGKIINEETALASKNDIRAVFRLY